MFKGRTFVFFCLCFCLLVGVFGDELKSVSVMERESVTLQSGVTDVTKMESADLMKWTFGTNGSLIAKISKDNSEIPDALDGRFRDRLKLDKKTGSLTITNTRTTDSGLYEVTISTSRSETKHRFTVTVTAAQTTDTSTSSSSSSPSSSPSPSSSEVHAHSCDSAEAVLRLVVTALMGVAAAAAAVLLINDIRATRGKTEETEQMS